MDSQRTLSWAPASASASPAALEANLGLKSRGRRMGLSGRGSRWADSRPAQGLAGRVGCGGVRQFFFSGLWWLQAWGGAGLGLSSGCCPEQVAMGRCVGPQGDGGMQSRILHLHRGGSHTSLHCASLGITAESVRVWGCHALMGKLRPRLGGTWPSHIALSWGRAEMGTQGDGLLTW